MNGKPWPKDGRPVSPTRLLTDLRKSMVKAGGNPTVNADHVFLKELKISFRYSLAVSVLDLPVALHGLFDWHIEVPASPCNRKIGSP